MGLHDKKCVPCEGGISPLTTEQAAVMIKQIPEWQLFDQSTRVKREFHFSNFAKALEFVNKVGEIAEKEGHHPDISLGWGYVTIALQTHAINGLH